MKHPQIRISAMLNYLLSIMILTTAFTPIASSQNDKVRERIEAKKMAFITERLDLNVEESQNFWPIYNELQNELDALKDKYPRPTTPLESMTDVEAEKMIQARFDKEFKELEIRKRYYEKFKKVISPVKFAGLIRIEEEFKKRLLDIISRREERMMKSKGF